MGIEQKKEECGVVAICSKKGGDVAPMLHAAMIALQHRGQDAAGFCVLDRGRLHAKKGLGLVSEIFRREDFAVKGGAGVAHTRYPTSGYIKEADAQPFVLGSIAIAHNGHIANYAEVKDALVKKGHRYESSVDSEAIAFMISDGMKAGGLEGAVKSVMESVDGAFSVVGIVGGKLVAFRDPHAIRPLVYGENEDYVCFASESCALDMLGIPYKGDIAGGELVVVEGGRTTRKTLAGGEPRHCMFEYVYFSRADSRINNRSVYEARLRLGEQLAKEHPVRADVVIPIPDTSRTAAESYSRALGIPVEEGLIKNRYIGRTFIMPTQETRSGAVRMKLNVVREVVAGKKVVLIDDSIVRGTTLREIARMVRDGGAKEVHVRITCPPLKAPCFYGVDMKTYKELIAHNKGVEEIRKFLGVESLGYISIGGLKKAIGLSVCTGCLNEDYVTPHARKLAKEKKDGMLGCG